MSDAGISITETHISTLFFTEDRVFKLKKAVDNGFLDFTTPEARRLACEREVELNRRLAPSVYLGVAHLAMADQDLDHFVVMQRLDPRRRLSAMVDRAEIDDHLTRIAGVVAEFHRHAARGREIDDAGSAAAQRALWRTGLEQLRPFVGPVLDAASVDRMTRLAERVLEATAAATGSRVAAGKVCDGHGDLLAEDIFCTADGPQILDCLEFDDQLRYGDVLADVAFLAMDLERLGHPALAGRFLERYRAASGDGWPASLEHLHIAYRAHVRAKVTCLRHEQGGEGALELARSFHDLALDHLERAAVDLVLVGGSPGTGKTTVARGVAARLGATRVSTDDVRAEVVDPDAGRAGTLHGGRYAPDQVQLVYDEVLARARPLLASGTSVVLDASWAREPARAAARQVARETGAHLTELCCVCPPGVAAARITARRAAGGDSSEVTPEIAARLTGERDLWPEATVIDTRPEPDTVLDAAATAVEPAGWPRATEPAG